jgi:hypothetical protein
MKTRLLKLSWKLMLLLFAGKMQADPLNQWAWRFPAPKGSTLEAVTYGEGQFVAVGYGTIVSSADGYSWVDQTTGAFPVLHGVAYADGEYATVGDGGAVLISSNAVNWREITPVTSATLRGIAGNPGWKTNGLPQFLAVGDSGVAVVCNNGTNWSTIPSGTSNTLYAVTRTSSYYIVVGTGGTVILFNNGGFFPVPQNWVGTTNSLYAVAAAGNGMVAAAGDLTPIPFIFADYYTNAILYSRNSGIIWTNEQWVIGLNGNPNFWYLSDFFILTGMAYGSNGFVAVGYTGLALEYHPAVVMTSTTGTSWTELASSTSENALKGITYGNGLYVAVGDFGSIVVSTNAVNWTEILPDRRCDIIAIACNTNRCIAASLQAWYSWNFPDFRMLVSTNGIGWTVSKTIYDLPTITDLACSPTEFVGISGPNIYTTTDGYHWQINNTFTNSFYGVRYANGRYIAVGNNGGIYASLDGTNWSNHSVATACNFNGVAYGNGLYAAAGSVAATSLDGITWTVCPSSPPATVTRIVYGRGVFVGIAYSRDTRDNPAGTILTSQDGVNWQIQFAQPDFYGFSTIAYNGGMFLANSGPYGGAYKSTDGTNWQQIAWSMPIGLYSYYTPVFRGAYSAICAYNGTFLIGGTDGNLFQSANIWTPATLTPSQSDSNGFTFSYNQQIDVPYRIEASTNLVSWKTIYTGIGSGQTTNFIVSTSSNYPAQFFHIVSP